MTHKKNVMLLVIKYQYYDIKGKLRESELRTPTSKLLGIQYTDNGILNPDFSGIATVLLFLSMGVILGITLTIRND